MEDYKVNVQLPKEEVTRIAKQIIREIINKEIGEAVQAALQEISIKEILESKLRGYNGKVKDLLSSEIRRTINDHCVGQTIKSVAREEVIARIGDKPLTGGIHIHLGERDVSTSYDDEDMGF